MVKDFLRTLTRYELGRLRVQSIPLPHLTRFNTAFELVNLHRISTMVSYEAETCVVR